MRTRGNPFSGKTPSTYIKKWKLSFIQLLIITTFILLLAGCELNFGDNQIRPALKNNENIKMEWAFTQDGHHPEQLLIEAIDSARHYLDIAIYSLTHPDIVKAIKEAHQRGVAVRLITDKSQLTGKTQTEAIKILGSAGVPMKVNSHSGLMHLKVTIIDRHSVATGSFNYSKAASTRNDEVLMLIHDADIADSFGQHFEALWSDTKKFEDVDMKIAQDTTGPVPEVASATSCDKPTIKGNINSKGEKIYHLPDGQYYAATIAEEMFCSPEEAELQGFRVASR